jgi:hypothetical protein
MFKRNSIYIIDTISKNRSFLFFLLIDDEQESEIQSSYS